MSLYVYTDFQSSTADPASMPVYGHQGPPYIWNRELELRFILEDGTLEFQVLPFSRSLPLSRGGRLDAVLDPGIRRTFTSYMG